MRIAVSGTHFIGKTTLIEDFLKKYPDYRCEKEAYYKLQDEKEMELSLEPSLDSFLEQLDYSIEQLNKTANEKNVVFDRCPIDFIAYSMIALEQDSLDINDSEVSERFDEIKIALNTLDLILFLPITKENSIEYTEENPAYRKAADKYFKKIYRDEVCDIFPRYGHPKGIIDKRAKLREKLESHADEIIDTLITRAKVGDSGALKLCVERLIPRVKSDDGIVFELPDGRLDVGSNMLQIAHDLTQAVALGRLTFEEAFKFSNFINNQRRLVRNAEQQIEEELDREERKKYWDERYKEVTSEGD